MRIAIFALTLAAAAAAPFAQSPAQQTPAPQPRPAAPAPAPGNAPANPPAAPAPQTPFPPSPLAQCALGTVVLDPAHGGSDPGAKGPNGVTVEADVVMGFARAARVALEGQGFCAVLTREGNEGKSFDERAAIVNGLRGAIFISLHAASTGTIGTARTYWYLYPAPAPGALDSQTQVFPSANRLHAGLVEWDRAQQAYLDASQRLAEQMQAQIAQTFTASPGAPAEAPVRQLRSIAAPAVAVEVSSVAVSDPAKLTQMMQPLAEAIARAASAFHSGAPVPAPAPGPAGAP